MHVCVRACVRACVHTVCISKTRRPATWCLFGENLAAPFLTVWIRPCEESEEMTHSTTEWNSNEIDQMCHHSNLSGTRPTVSN